MNRISNNQSLVVKYSGGISGSFTLGVPHVLGAYSTKWVTSSAKVSLVTPSGSSVEVVDGVGYEVVGTASSQTIRRLSP